MRRTGGRRAKIILQQLTHGKMSFGVALSFVESIGQRLELGERQLQRHSIVMIGGRVLEQIGEQQYELRETLHRLHHQAEETQPIGTRQGLGLQKLCKRRLGLGCLSGSLHCIGEIVDKVRVDVQHHRL